MYSYICVVQVLNDKVSCLYDLQTDMYNKKCCVDKTIFIFLTTRKYRHTCGVPLEYLPNTQSNTLDVMQKDVE